MASAPGRVKRVGLRNSRTRSQARASSTSPAAAAAVARSSASARIAVHVAARATSIATASSAADGRARSFEPRAGGGLERARARRRPPSRPGSWPCPARRGPARAAPRPSVVRTSAAACQGSWGAAEAVPARARQTAADAATMSGRSAIRLLLDRHPELGGSLRDLAGDRRRAVLCLGAEHLCLLGREALASLLARVEILDEGAQVGRARARSARPAPDRPRPAGPRRRRR